MSENLDILKCVWDSKIPVRLQLAPEELASEDRIPSPFYMHAPRLSYFPLILERAVRYFIDFTESGLLKNGKRINDLQSKSPQTDLSSETFQSVDRIAKDGDKAQSTPNLDKSPEYNVWLEYANQPLKWHYPIGLLFDLHSDKMELPWKLTLHFQGYPSDVLLPPPVHRRAVEIHFMNMLKEADALKHRSQVMNQMQARDHRQLWTGLLNHQFEQYWSINRKLMNPVIPPNEDQSSSHYLASVEHNRPQVLAEPKAFDLSPSVSQSLGAFRLLPCRLYLVDKMHAATAGRYIQRRLKPYVESGQLLTLICAMHQLLHPEKEHDHDCSQDPELEKYQFSLHGVLLPNDVPVQWLCEQLTYADNFIHIVAHSRCQSPI